VAGTAGQSRKLPTSLPLHHPEREAHQPKLAPSSAALGMQRDLVTTRDLREARLGQRYSAFGPSGIHVSCKSPVRSTKLQSLVPSRKLLTNCTQHNLPSASACMRVRPFHQGRRETPGSITIVVLYDSPALHGGFALKRTRPSGVTAAGACCGERRESYHWVLPKVTRKR